jgi:flagellar L-ring protein precursor FlgH
MNSFSLKNITIISILSLILCSCNIPDRLSRVGTAPEFNEINTFEDDIIPKDPYNDTSLVNGNGQNIALSDTPTPPKTANSLWRPGARAFFRDQRARSIGDILKVIVTIQDKAQLNNKTTTSRNDSGTSSAPNILGYEKYAKKILPDTLDTSKLLDVKTVDNNSGEGKVDRKETINTTIAATVIKILPSNNLVIKGSQEIRVNYEIREITIEGIVRPEDISAQNSVTLDQIAEARVSYAGKGNISDYQQPRYGKQIMDIISPF